MRARQPGIGPDRVTNNDVIDRTAPRRGGFPENVNVRGTISDGGATMSEHPDGDQNSAPDGVNITARVCVFPSTDDEAHGVVVDDFGDMVGVPVEIGGNRIAGPARRWAVMLDDDNLVFVDSHQLVAE